jgi:hypothetical protein
LKIEAAEVSGDVDDLADEIEPRHRPRFEGFGGNFRRIDAAQRDLRGAVAFGAVRNYGDGAGL